MSRAPLAITFTEAERRWLAKLLKKKVAQARRPEFKKDNEKLARLLRSALKKTESPGSPERKYYRQEMRIFESLVHNHYQFATTSVIPELSRRINKNSHDMRAKWKVELTKVEQRSEMLLNLLNKIREAL